jgi:anaerobic magnesium-protoporphyrin IX monomethyl ester cyclase
MKVLFIDPPYAVFTGFFERYFCPGMAQLAAILRSKGHECQIFEADTLRGASDLDFTNEYHRLQAYIDGLSDEDHWIWKQIEKVIDEFKPDVLGIHCLTMKFGSVVRVAEVCKKYNPEITVLVGGPHATDWPEMPLKCPAIDYTLRGEADDSIVDFINCLESGTNEWAKVPGVVYREDGVVKHGPKPELPQNLSRLPRPARDLLMNQDKYTSEDMGLILTARGCPYDCTFCSHERKVRYRDIDEVMTKMHQAMEVYGTNQFTFKDDSFTIKRPRTTAFCEQLLKEGFDINWECTTRVNLLGDELMDLMCRSGLNEVKVGIETGSARVLETISKKASFQQMKHAADEFASRDVFWTGYFMYGLPTETFHDMKQTYYFMKELNPHHAGLGLYAPLPNTPLWYDGINQGLVDSEVGIDHFFKTNPKDYFLKDPTKRVLTMDQDEFEHAASWMMGKFHDHNIQTKTLARRAWIRRKSYQRDPKLFLHHVKAGLRWKKWWPGVDTLKKIGPKLRLAS